MSELPISAGEAQGIFNVIWPAFKVKFLYSFDYTIKTNKDHIEIAFKNFELNINKIMNTIVNDLIDSKKHLPEGSAKFFKSISTIDRFESQKKAIMQTPIIGQLLELHIIQNKEFQKILNRAEHAIDSYLILYRKESLKYAESKIPNTKLLKKEREKLVKMAELCLRDMQTFINLKFLDLVQWLIIQSIQSPLPQNIDIEGIGAQFSMLGQKDYYKEVTVCFDNFLGEMIDLITTE